MLASEALGQPQKGVGQGRKKAQAETRQPLPELTKSPIRIGASHLPFNLGGLGFPQRVGTLHAKPLNYRCMCPS